MIKQKGRMRRQLAIFGSAIGSTGDLVAGLGRKGSGRAWMIPLVIFLCATGLILTLAAGVEALAPFIYTIF